LQFVKSMQSLLSKTTKDAGLTIYSMDRRGWEYTIDNTLFNLIKMRKSKLLYERSFYKKLYKKIREFWRTPELIVLDGNAGTGFFFSKFT
jgi:hypothetical protein